jgi:hypothetical protein
MVLVKAGYRPKLIKTLRIVPILGFYEHGDENPFPQKQGISCPVR